MKKQIKIVFGIIFCIIFTFIFANVFALEKPTINMTADGDFYIGEAQEFSITTVVPDEYETITVVGDGSISDSSAIAKLEYYEVNDGNWYELPEGTQFGGTSGFPLVNATSRFRVTFKKAGNYSVTYAVKEVETNEIVAENKLDIKVVDKSIRTVSTADELKSALEDANVKTIDIVKDITTSAKINIVRDVVINGNSHKIELETSDKTAWYGHYVLQAYRCNVTISDITLTGGNAGLLINGSNLILKGAIDVSNNGFGGIELAKSGEYKPSIDLSNATLVNSTEEYLKPTIWTDPKMEDVTVNYSELYNKEIDKGDHLQTQYYLKVDNTVDTIDNQLRAGINSGDALIELISNGNDSISKELLNELKAGKEKEVVIYQQLAKISFKTKNITEDFKKDLSLKIDITKEQPFKSDILKDVKANMIYIDLEYDGALPKDTKISINLNNFDVGTKLYLYYYNQKTDSVKLISDKIVIDDTNWATITLDHASTYILASDKIVTETSNISNPNTSDITMFVAFVLAVIATIGFVYVLKIKRAENQK